MMKNPPDIKDPIAAVCQIAADLRDPSGGCPWDIKQDHKSMIPHLIEECYETVDTLFEVHDSREKNLSPEKINQAYSNLKEELGDLFFQVVFHAQLAAEQKIFSLNDIAQTLAQKLIFRHPHVYAPAQLSEKIATSDQVLKKWEQLKRDERAGSEDNSTLAGVPRHLPALQKSFRMGQKAARLNFDWPVGKVGIEALKVKVMEEYREFICEIPQSPENLETDHRAKSRLTEELGDLFFALCQFARHLHINPEEALETSNQKFIRRFKAMEKNLAERLNQGEHPSLDEWEEQWQKVKIEEKSQPER